MNDAQGCLFLFYDVRGLVVEGRKVFEQAVAAWETKAPDRGDGTHQRILASLLARFGGMATYLDTYAAIKPLEISLTLLRQYDDPPLLAFALGQYGLALTESGKPSEGRPYLEESYACYRALDDHFWQAMVLCDLGYATKKLHAWEDARRLYQKSFDLAEAIDSRYAAFWSVNSLGHAALLVGDTRVAASWFAKAKAYASEIGYVHGLVDALASLAMLSRMMGNYDQAQQYATQELAIAREIGLARLIGIALRNQGDLAIVQGNLDEAEQCFQEALAMTSQAAHPKEHFRTLTGLAMLAGVDRDHPATNQRWQEALSICRASGDRYNEACTLGNMGWNYYISGAYVEAKALCEHCLAILQELDLGALATLQFVNLGHVTGALGNDEASKQYYLDALIAYWDMERIPDVLEVIAGMSRHLAHAGELTRAVEVLTLINHHRATEYEVKQTLAAPLLAELEAELSPKVFAAAQERGRALDLAAVVEELLRD